MINVNGARRDIVAIGASAGGIEALIYLFSKLPPRLPAAIAVVVHRSPVFETRLPWVLGRRAGIPVLEPSDGQPFETGRIYTAPRDQHLVLEDSVVRLNRGPKEHRTRPAVDPLFRSAAQVYGPRVVGVLLSGFGDDGVSGLIAITDRGGISIVQDPGEARHSSMPRNAIAEDDVDAVLPLDGIAAALVALASGHPFEARHPDERAV